MRQFYKQSMALRIKALREKKSWTQTDLAERANMSRSQLAMIENETRPANTLRLNAIAAALGVTPPELFERSAIEEKILQDLSQMSEDDKETVARLAESLAAKAALTSEKQ